MAKRGVTNSNVPPACQTDANIGPRPLAFAERLGQQRQLQRQRRRLLELYHADT